MRKIILSAVFLLLLSGCNKSRLETTTPTETRGHQKVFSETSENFNEFIIHGTKVSVPCSYSELINLGFVDESEGDNAFTGTITFIRMSFQDSFDNEFSVGFSASQKDLPKEQWYMDSFQWEADTSNETDAIFYGGIHKDSTEEEVAAILPRMSKEEDGTTQYGIVYDKVGYSGIMVTFSDGKLESIMINNTKNQ